MIAFQQVLKEYPDKVLFRDVNFTIHARNRVGLVGPNGAGKTTIFRLLLGVEDPDAGQIVKPASLSLGYLPQDITATAEHSILHEVMQGRDDLVSLDTGIQALIQVMEEGSGSHDDAEKLGRLQRRFEDAGGYSWEPTARQILGGLGFTEDQFQQPLLKFSGGWRMRVALARLLLQEPDVLLLDEPTNHLDLASLIWLENYLQSWPGTLILISHDRKFLDGTVDHILSIDRRQVQLVKGNYSAYTAQLDLIREQQLAAYKQQQREIEAIERFIERFRYKNTKATQVQSRVKMLEKMERIEPPHDPQKGINLRIPQPDRAPRILTRLSHVDKAYGDNQVFTDLSCEIERGDKVGLVGANGAGKSTLLKMLAKVEPLSAGTLGWTESVKRAYFAQHQVEQLDGDDTVLGSLERIVPNWTQTELRSYLGGFLFSGDAINKKVRVLSGGETSRLALSRLLAEPAHILLLDEPTNHLDMQSRDMVAEALRSYTGSLVCISHDRHFLNAVTNRVWEVGGGGVRQFEGNYDYYLWKLEQESALEDTEDPDLSEKVSSSSRSDHGERRRLSNRLKKLPELVSAAEAELSAVESRLTDPELNSDYVALQAALEERQALEERLMMLMEEEERLRDELG